MSLQEGTDQFINIEDLPNFKLKYVTDDDQYKTQQPQEVAKTFLRELDYALQTKNQDELLYLYDHKFNKISDHHFKQTQWPTAEEIEQTEDNLEFDINTKVLYAELGYRHIYARMSNFITPETRIQSWANYEMLFEIVTTQRNRDDLALPVNWVWDILDEFLYQYSAFCQFRAKMKEDDENFKYLCESRYDFWNLDDIVKFLKKNIEASKIVRSDKTALEDIPNPKTIHYFGYFSMVSLLRLNVIISDLDVAVKSVELIDNKSLVNISKAYACMITLFYYAGFSYLMKGRYKESIKMFELILAFITKYKQFFTRSFQYETIVRQAERAISLLAISTIFYPTEIDRNVANLLNEKLGDKLEKLQKYDTETFKECFNYGCPKLVVPIKDKEHFENFGFDKQVMEPVNQLRDSLLNQFLKIQKLNDFSSVLKVYSVITIPKIAKIMKVDEIQLKELLEQFKSRNKIQLNDSPFEKKVISTLIAQNYQSFDFTVENDTIKVNEKTTKTNYSKIFSKFSSNIEQLLTEIENL